MDLFKCHTFEWAIDHETGLTRSQIQQYYSLIDKLQRLDNLIYNYKLELNRRPRQIDQISEPRQGGNFLLKLVMTRHAKESKLGDEKEPPSKSLISPS